jgi:hypothetical protein
MPEAPTEMDWRKEAFVTQRRTEEMCAQAEIMKAETGITHAAVVNLSWLEAQIPKLKAQGQETIRIAAVLNEENQPVVYIESWEEDAGKIRGYTGDPTMDPPGWNNDWPIITVP